MKVKKLIITGIALLGLAGVSGISANASSYLGGDAWRASKTSYYARKGLKLERLNHSSYFAGIRPTGSAWIHRGEHVGIVPFYHMGHDGFIVHIPGRSGIYYAMTNSYRWYTKRRPHHYKKHRKHSFYYNYKKEVAKDNKKYKELDHPKVISSKYKATSNPALWENSDTSVINNSIDCGYNPNDKRAYAPSDSSFNHDTSWYNINTNHEWTYAGNGHWSPLMWLNDDIQENPQINELRWILIIALLLFVIGIIIYGLIIAGIIYLAFMAVGGFLALVFVICIGLIAFGLLCWLISAIIGLFTDKKSKKDNKNQKVTTTRVKKYDK